MFLVVEEEIEVSSQLTLLFLRLIIFSLADLVTDCPLPTAASLESSSGLFFELFSSYLTFALSLPLLFLAADGLWLFDRVSLPFLGVKLKTIF